MTMIKWVVLVPDLLSFISTHILFVLLCDTRTRFCRSGFSFASWLRARFCQQRELESDCKAGRGRRNVFLVQCSVARAVHQPSIKQTPEVATASHHRSEFPPFFLTFLSILLSSKFQESFFLWLLPQMPSIFLSPVLRVNCLKSS